jgi:HPr kinase/phosphorylase
VQIVGRREVAYLRASRRGPGAPHLAHRHAGAAGLIVADDQVPPDRLVAMCDRAEIPLFVTRESAGHVIDVVRGYLASCSPSAPRATACSWTSSAWACC